MIFDPRLHSDSTFIADLGLCQVHLGHNAIFPWIILLPQRPDLREIIDLSMADQQRLTQEIDLSCRVMRSLFSPIKLNVANLGNVVAQLHIHVIARYDTDPAWPGPVWGHSATASYSSTDQVARIALIREAFKETPLQPLSSPLAQMNAAAVHAAHIGFDWESPFEAAEKIREELEEVLVELRKEPSPLRDYAIQDELGDLFFICAGLARHCGVDPDTAVMTGLRKFQKQYARFEAHIKAEGLNVFQMTVPERIATWRKFKDKSGFPHAAFPLETERLILRPLEDEDAVPLATTSNDERVSKNLARLPFPYTLADAEAFIAKVKAERQQKPDVVLAVIRKVDQAFIGVASIEEERLGYGLGHAFWGQGYGTEAITALVNFWFSILQMPKLRASALVTNVASQRILEKLGFVQTGTKECSSLAYEGTKPGFLYELFQEDFLKRGEAA